MAQAPVFPPPRRTDPDPPVRLGRLAAAVGRLDPATRALLDLSVRRGVRDDAMAPILHTDPFHLAWRRARALERLASEAGEAGRPAPLGEVRMALEALPREAWGLPGAGPPALPRAREGPVAEEARPEPALSGDIPAGAHPQPTLAADSPAGAHPEPALAGDIPAGAVAEPAARADRVAATGPDAAVTGPAVATDRPATAEPARAPAAATGTELVPTATGELDTPPPPGRLARLDAFAAESPTLRLALRQLGRALAAKAVRVVVWRRRADC
jgi:hypothetical protein